MQAEVGGLGRSASSAQGPFDSLGGVLKATLAAAGGLAVFNTVKGALSSAASSAIDFEASMSGIKAVSGATGEQMAQFTQLALDLGKKTSFSASQAAEGIQELLKGGVQIGEVFGAAGPTLNLAAAGGISVGRAAEIAANAMSQFGLKGADMENVANKIAGAANASSLEVGDFASSIQYVGAVARTAGISFDSTAEAIAVLGQAGIKGSEAGTALRSVLASLQPASKPAADEMRRLGLITADGANAFFDASGKAKDFAGIAQVLQNATKGMTDQQKLASLEIIFGREAMSAAAIVAREGAAGFDTMRESMGKVTAEAVAMERLNNVRGDLEQLRGSAETLGIVLLSTLSPAFRTALQAATDFVNTVTQEAQTLIKTAENIAGEHGLGMIPAALVAIELRIGEVFGGKAQQAFHNFVDVVKVTSAAVGQFASWTTERLGEFAAVVTRLFAGDIRGAFAGYVQYVERVGHDVGVALQAWGRAFLDWITPLLPGIRDRLAQLGASVLSWIGAQTPQLAAALGKWTVEFVNWVGAALPRLIDQLRVLVVGMLRQIDASKSEVAAGVTASWVGPIVGWVVKEAVPALARALPSIGIALLRAIAEIEVELWRAMARMAEGAVIALGKGLAAVAVTVWEKLSEAQAKVDAWRNELVLGALAATGEFIAAVASGLASLAVEFWNKLVEAQAKIDTWKVGLANAALAAGGDFVAGFVRGITAGLGSVGAAAWDLGKRAIASLQKATEEHSPSRVAAEAGAFFSEGFARGIDRGGAMAEAAAAGLGGDTLDALRDAVGARAESLDAGRDVAAALAHGIDADAAIAELAATDLGEGTLGALEDALDAGGDAIDEAMAALGQGATESLGEALAAGGEAVARAMTTIGEDAIGALAAAIGATFPQVRDQVAEAQAAIDGDIEDENRAHQRRLQAETIKWGRDRAILEREVGQATARERADALERLQDAEAKHNGRIEDLTRQHADRLVDIEVESADRIAEAQRKQNEARGAALRDFQRNFDTLVRETEAQSRAIGERAGDAIKDAIKDAGKAIQDARDRFAEFEEDARARLGESRILRGRRDDFGDTQDFAARQRQQRLENDALVEDQAKTLAEFDAQFADTSLDVIRRKRQRAQEERDLEYQRDRDLEEAKTDEDRQGIDDRFRQAMADLRRRRQIEDDERELRRKEDRAALELRLKDERDALARRRAAEQDERDFRATQEQARRVFEDTLENEALKKSIDRAKTDRDERIKAIQDALADKQKEIEAQETRERKALKESFEEKERLLRTALIDKIGPLTGEAKTAFDAFLEGVAKKVADVTRDIVTNTGKAVAGLTDLAAASSVTIANTPGPQQGEGGYHDTNPTTGESIPGMQWWWNGRNYEPVPRFGPGSGDTAPEGGYGPGIDYTPESYMPDSNSGYQQFAGGGIVQGPPGSAQMVVAHAGERVLTPEQQRAMGMGMGGRPIVINLNGTYLGNDDYLLQQLARLLRPELERLGGRVVAGV